MISRYEWGSDGLVENVWLYGGTRWKCVLRNNHRRDLGCVLFRQERVRAETWSTNQCVDEDRKAKSDARKNMLDILTVCHGMVVRLCKAGARGELSLFCAHPCTWEGLILTSTIDGSFLVSMRCGSCKGLVQFGGKGVDTFARGEGHRINGKGGTYAGCSCGMGPSKGHLKGCVWVVGTENRWFVLGLTVRDHLGPTRCGGECSEAVLIDNSEKHLVWLTGACFQMCGGVKAKSLRAAESGEVAAKTEVVKEK